MRLILLIKIEITLLPFCYDVLPVLNWVVPHFNKLTVWDLLISLCYSFKRPSSNTPWVFPSFHQFLWTHQSVPVRKLGFLFLPTLGIHHSKGEPTRVVFTIPVVLNPIFFWVTPTVSNKSLLRNDLFYCIFIFFLIFFICLIVVNCFFKNAESHLLSPAPNPALPCFLPGWGCKMSKKENCRKI